MGDVEKAMVTFMGEATGESGHVALGEALGIARVIDVETSPRCSILETVTSRANRVR